MITWVRCCKILYARWHGLHLEAEQSFADWLQIVEQQEDTENLRQNAGFLRHIQFYPLTGYPLGF